jgi:hypothetical protein
MGIDYNLIINIMIALFFYKAVRRGVINLINKDSKPKEKRKTFQERLNEKKNQLDN